MTFKSQIFKKLFPINDFIAFLKTLCPENDKYFILSKTIYRKGIFHNLIDPFISILTDYYHESKKYYIQRKINYSQFITIIRQICKINKISYVSKIIYDKSNYEIIYHIYK